MLNVNADVDRQTWIDNTAGWRMQWLFFFLPRWAGTNCKAPVLNSFQDIQVPS